MSIAANTLHYGDCLDIMAEFDSDSIDLICLDPPFNSNEKYHTIFKGSGLSIEPQLKAFDDMWHWDDESAESVETIKNAIANPASKVIAGFEQFIPQPPMLSYTSYMAQRLFEMHRILKPTGSIYLHCDPTASHYLKLVMDAVFGENNFRNEIVWCYKRMASSKHGFGMLLHKPDNMDRKGIVVQVTGASGSQRAKFDRLQTTIRNSNAAMGILLTLETQSARRNWRHTLAPVIMGESRYEPIQCFSVEAYFAIDGKWESLLNLPSLANPWTGKEIQRTLFDRS